MKYFATIVKNLFYNTPILFLLGVFCSCETTEQPSIPKKLISITEIVKETPLITGRSINFTYEDKLLTSISKYIGPLLIDSLLVNYDNTNDHITSLNSTTSNYSTEYIYLKNGLLNQIIENLEFEPEQSERTKNQRHTTTAFTKDSLVYEDNQLVAIINKTYDDHWVPLDSLIITYKINTNGDLIQEFSKGTKTEYKYSNIESPLKNFPIALSFDRKYFLSVIYPFGASSCKTIATSTSDQILQKSFYTTYFTEGYIDKIKEEMTYTTPNEELSSEKYWKVLFE